MSRSADPRQTSQQTATNQGAGSGQSAAGSKTGRPGLSSSFAAKPKSPLDARTIEMVQNSWAKVRPISDAAATLFYDRLFKLDPSAKPLFKSSMGAQKMKLMQTLNVAVEGLRTPNKLVPVLEELGIRHAGYMVQEHHYDRVGEALLWTLQEGLGDDFTPEIRQAWTTVYDFIATVMKRAAAGHADSPKYETTLRSAAPAAPKPATRRPSAAAHPRTLPRAEPPPSPSDGSLDTRTVELVRSSWAKVRPISEAAATLFYDRLFKLDPSVKPLFKSSMGAQKMKLMQTLSVAVDGLRDPGKLVPVLSDLGVRHAGYMVQEHHYDLVGEALLWTLQEGLGDEFTDETRQAWTAVYSFISRVMKRAAAARDDSADSGPSNAASASYSAATAASPRGATPVAPAPPPEQPLSQKSRPTPSQPPTKSSDSASQEIDARTVELVQSSWAKVRPISDAAATMFYTRLFELEPSVRPLFKEDMTEQKKKLMQTLSVAVDGLRNPDKLVPVLSDLGVRHAGYMVQDPHYDRVGEALLWTLEEGLGDEFTDEVRVAWTKVYGFVAGVMKSAAAAHERAQAPEPASPATTPPLGTPAVPADEDVETLHYPESRRAANNAPSAAQPLAASGQAQIAQGLVVPVGEDMAIKVHLVMDPSVQLAPKAQENEASNPDPASKKPASGGLGIALLLAIVCGTTVLIVSSIFLPNLAEKIADTPTFMLYVPPLAAAVLTSSAFLLGYLWSRRN